MRAIRDANRPVLRQPAFVTLVVLTLGTGIGATTAAVNVASSVLFSPLPLSDESQLVLITKVLPIGKTLTPFTPAEMVAWSEATRTLTAVGGVQYDGAWPWTADIGSVSTALIGTTVSGNFFAVLGAEPAAGRLLAEEDAWVGAEPVAVIADGLWQRQFGRDPTVMGRRVRLNGRETTIVGVAPAGFSYPKGAEVWQPLAGPPEVVEEGWFNLVARRPPGCSSSLRAPLANSLGWARDDLSAALGLLLLERASNLLKIVAVRLRETVPDSPRFLDYRIVGHSVIPSVLPECR